MRRILLICALALSLALTLSSCQEKKNREAATVVAEEFMEAYFSTRFDDAAKLCCDDLRTKILEAQEIYQAQKDGVQAAMTQMAADVKHHLSEVDSENRDSIKFHIEVTIPDSSDTQDTYLTIAKVGEDWKIVELN